MPRAFRRYYRGGCKCALSHLVCNLCYKNEWFKKKPHFCILLFVFNWQSWADQQKQMDAYNFVDVRFLRNTVLKVSLSRIPTGGTIQIEFKYNPKSWYQSEDNNDSKNKQLRSYHVFEPWVWYKRCENCHFPLSGRQLRMRTVHFHRPINICDGHGSPRPWCLTHHQ